MAKIDSDDAQEIGTQEVCVLCLARDKPKSDKEERKEFETHSFRHFLSYIHITKMDLFPSSTCDDSLSDVNLKVTMCHGCSSIVSNFNALHTTYESLRTQLNQSVAQMLQRMAEGNESPKRVRDYNTHMMSTTLTKYYKRFTDNLRKETISKSYQKIVSSNGPRSRVSRRQEFNVFAVVSNLVDVTSTEHIASSGDESQLAPEPTTWVLEQGECVRDVPNLVADVSTKPPASCDEPQLTTDATTLLIEQGAGPASDLESEIGAIQRQRVKRKRKQVHEPVSDPFDEDFVHHEIKEEEDEEECLVDPLGDLLADPVEDPLADGDPLEDEGEEAVSCSEKHEVTPTRPPFSYFSMIIQAIASAPGRQRTLRGIYVYISKQYPYYKLGLTNCRKGWQKAICNALSSNRHLFYKVPRENPELMGDYWKIRPEEEASLISHAFTPNWRLPPKQPKRKVKRNTLVT